MSEPAEQPRAHRSRLRLVRFVLVTVIAVVLDSFMTIPGIDVRQGDTWTAFGRWEVTVVASVAAMAVLYTPLLLRRRFPLVVFLYMTAVTVALAFAWQFSQPMVGLLVALYSAASLIPGRWLSRLALVAAVAALSTGLIAAIGADSPDALYGVGLLTTVAVAFWLFGRRDYASSVLSENLPDQLAEHGDNAAAQERQRIARDLHDILAHSVSAMMMQAAGARAVSRAVQQDVPNDQRLKAVERALTTIESTGSQSMRELQRLLGVMRGDEPGADLDSSSSQPGLVDILQLAEVTRQSGLLVTLHRAGPMVSLDPSVGLAAYRVVQESLANAMKYAGRGAVVDVFENWATDRLQLQVRCKGGHDSARPASAGGGTGLYGLRERVALVGGTFEWGWVGEEFVTTAVFILGRSVVPGAAEDPDPTISALTNGRHRDARLGIDRVERL